MDGLGPRANPGVSQGSVWLAGFLLTLSTCVSAAAPSPRPAAPPASSGKEPPTGLTFSGRRRQAPLAGAGGVCVVPGEAGAGPWVSLLLLLLFVRLEGWVPPTGRPPLLGTVLHKPTTAGCAFTMKELEGSPYSLSQQHFCCRLFLRSDRQPSQASGCRDSFGLRQHANPQAGPAAAVGTDD